MRTGQAIRLTLAYSLVVLILLLLFAHVLSDFRAPHIAGRLAGFDESSQSSVGTVVDWLRSRWYGEPALWQAPELPANTELRFYDVQGSDQNSLWESMLAAKLCEQYTCLPDPGAGGASGALALEGDIPANGGNFVCYSPRTVRLTYRHFILLPRWSPKLDGSVSINTVEAWNALLGVFFIHESRHVAIAEADIAALNAQAEALPNCAQVVAFWENPHVFDQLGADQNAYHAKLRADCEPQLGCVPYGWLGWG